MFQQRCSYGYMALAALKQIFKSPVEYRQPAPTTNATMTSTVSVSVSLFA